MSHGLSSTAGSSLLSSSSLSLSLSSLSLSSSLLVCSVVDGSVYTFDAWTGAVVEVFHTGRPLVSSSHPEMVSPGLDGYVHFGTVAAMSLQELLHRPVLVCADDEVRSTCGIVAATKVTSLFGLHAKSGQLAWTSNSIDSNNDKEEKYPLQQQQQQQVVLQREDFLVQQISTTTGKELWNATLGHFSALAFDDIVEAATVTAVGLIPTQQQQQQQQQQPQQQPQQQHTNSYNPGTKESLPYPDSHEVPIMPSIMFDEIGQTLTVVHQTKIIWKQTLHSFIASVYGISHGQWVPLTVREEDGLLTDHHLLQQQPQQFQITNFYQLPLLPLHSDLFDQHKQHLPQYTAAYGGLVVYRPPHVLPVCDENGISKNSDISLSSPNNYSPSPPSIHTQNHFPATPSQGGLFVTWNMIWIFFTILVATAKMLVMWYETKKKKWITTPSLLSTSNPQTDDLTPLTLEHTNSSHHNGYITTSIKRSISMPFLNEDPTSSGTHYKLLTQQPNFFTHKDEFPPSQAAAVTAAATTKTNPSALQPSYPHQLDGIPLVRYSRYKSEFKELTALGRGGFGTVFSCENVLDGRDYAIKKIWIKNYDDPQVTKDQLQRVLREVKILALLDHPNIVRYYTAWLELEDHTGSDEFTADESYITNSKGLSKCYSSECLTTMNGGRERPSQLKRPKKRTVANPLGWNNFLNDYSTNEEFSQRKSIVHGSLSSMDGFVFERSESNVSLQRNCSNFSSAGGILKTIHDSREHDRSDTDESVSFSNDISIKESTKSFQQEVTPKQGNQQLRHTLYIQMQLCSQKSLQDFLSNRDARRRNELDVNAIDLPFALGLFGQVAQGVQHVHNQGLIHRDLKPSNCFMDDIGVVKVGDFGLSRESTATPDQLMNNSGHGLGGDADNTAGVGTRSYASPEQMNGSDYDASTDVYSLGVLLFELCYPMYTGMERHIVFSRVRNRDFPTNWKSTVAKAFPELQLMLESMLSPKPSDRPSADTVASHMKSLMSEFTVQSIDKSHSDRGATLLRVEATSNDEGILNRTIKLIKEVAPAVKIEQYGLRGGEDSAIMEFALSTYDDMDSLRAILSTLRATTEIKLVRQVSHNVHQSK